MSFLAKMAYQIGYRKKMLISIFVIALACLVVYVILIFTNTSIQIIKDNKVIYQIGAK